MDRKNIFSFNLSSIFLYEITSIEVEKERQPKESITNFDLFRQMSLAKRLEHTVISNVLLARTTTIR